MADDWSREEVEAAVADYFAMLAKEFSGVSYNKAEHNRRLQKILIGRSRGSIEFKHQNITAVLIELGFANIPDYKPRFNYQDLLHVVVEDRLANAKQLQEAAHIAVEKPVDALPVVEDILSILVPPPIRDDKPESLREKPHVKRKLLPRRLVGQAYSRAGNRMKIVLISARRESRPTRCCEIDPIRYVKFSPLSASGPRLPQRR
jgi:hypothetical protein